MDMNAILFVFIIIYSVRNFVEYLIEPKNIYIKPIRHRGRVSFFLLVTCHIIAGVFNCIYLYFNGAQNILLYGIGLIIFIGGFAGRVYTVKYLGVNYTKSVECVTGGVLLTRGPYSIIRHPVHLFYIIEMLGFLFVNVHFITIATLIIVIFAALSRIKLEESELLQRYKDGYYEYMKQTRKIIPFVY